MTFTKIILSDSFVPDLRTKTYLELWLIKIKNVNIFSLKKQVPSIDVDCKDGKVPENLEGNVEFKKVSFNYPSRPDVQVK